MTFVNLNAHINQVPSPNGTVFVSAYNRCFFMSKACSAAIRCVVVASEGIEKFTTGCIK